jgi:hypothetical protein
MRGLLIENGDLVVGQGGFVLTDGPAKVRQDLNHAAAEPLGIDRFHPKWGSLLDRFVGQPNSEEIVALVRGEMNRLVQNYISIQNYNLREDQRLGRRNRYRASELVSTVEAIDVRQEYDRFFVRVRVTTFGGETITLAGSVTG